MLNFRFVFVFVWRRGEGATMSAVWEKKKKSFPTRDIMIASLLSGLEMMYDLVSLVLANEACFVALVFVLLNIY